LPPSCTASQAPPSPAGCGACCTCEAALDPACRRPTRSRARSRSPNSGIASWETWSAAALACTGTTLIWHLSRRIARTRARQCAAHGDRRDTGPGERRTHDPTCFRTAHIASQTGGAATGAQWPTHCSDGHHGPCTTPRHSAREFLLEHPLESCSLEICRRQRTKSKD
jgi:hypothetical protein